MSTQDIDWETVDSDVTDFVFCQAERHLEAQLQCGIASDARAVTAASILAGLGGAVFAGSIGLLATGQVPELVPAGLTLGAMVLLAAYLCFLSARPVDFYAPGNQPAEWYGCLDLPLRVSKGCEIENYQEMIQENAAALKASADNLVAGMRMALVSAPATIFVYLITYLS